MSIIIDTIRASLPAKRKHTPSNWISFNAPCCMDKRNRGGIIINADDSLSYHCFNCGFKTSWQPGRTLSHKMRKLMRFFHINDDVIAKLGLEALRLNTVLLDEPESFIPTFSERALPLGSECILDLLEELPPKLVPVLAYLASRNLCLDDYPFYWNPKIGFNNRLIIPFYYQQQIVGYTARTISSDINPRYLSEQQPGYVFNLDKQSSDREFVIVCEGPIDAISIDACALMGSEIKDSQNWLLHQLNREIVLVPDRDHAGLKTVTRALEHKWSVSMPDWPDDIKDINDAVIKLGRLATLWLIVQAKQSNNLKIQLKAKSWFKKVIHEKNNEKNN